MKIASGSVASLVSTLPRSCRRPLVHGGDGEDAGVGRRGDVDDPGGADRRREGDDVEQFQTLADELGKEQ
jgi:hypothetical protein